MTDLDKALVGMNNAIQEFDGNFFSLSHDRRSRYLAMMAAFNILKQEAERIQNAADHLANLVNWGEQA